MALFLIESTPGRELDRQAVSAALERAAAAARERGGDLLEAQVAGDLSRVFAVLEGPDAETVKQAFRAGGLPVQLIKQVRLVGQDLAEVRKSRDQVDYVVEWNLPANLTMEAYLERKKANSPRYAEVPEVRFLRTYVCEDMTKCVCFYDAAELEDVLRARQAVQAPVDAVSRVSPGPVAPADADQGAAR
ncbi:MAG TPA: DUF4242 domain-containing protein [Bacillota bacterium]